MLTRGVIAIMPTRKITLSVSLEKLGGHANVRATVRDGEGRPVGGAAVQFSAEPPVPLHKPNALTDQEGGSEAVVQAIADGPSAVKVTAKSGSAKASITVDLSQIVLKIQGSDSQEL